MLLLVHHTTRPKVAHACRTADALVTTSQLINALLGSTFLCSKGPISPNPLVALHRCRLWTGCQEGAHSAVQCQHHVQAAAYSLSVSLNPHSKPGCALCCSFRKGRQEDAHEYLVALLDAMHEAQVAGVQPRPPTAVAQTSLIYSIFAGRIRSQVSRCHP